MGEAACLLAAALWAFASVLWVRVGTQVPALPLNAIKCGLATVVLVALVPLTGEGLSGPWRDLAILAASGVAGLTLGDTAYFHALQRIGARRTLLGWATVPFVTALMALPFLDEALTPGLLGGMTLTMVGVGWVVAERGDSTAVRRSGYLFAALAVLGQAAGNVMVRYAGEEVGALSAAVWRIAAATIGLGVHLALVRRLSEVLPPLRDRALVPPILVATLTGTVAGIFLSVYGLLHAEHVAVAVTLLSTSPLFVLPLAWFWQGERFGVRAVLGAALAIAGVAVFLFSGAPP